MADDVIIRIRTAFEKGGIAAAEAELLKLASAGARASADTDSFSSRLGSLNQGLRGSALNAAQFSQKLSQVAPEIQKASSALQQFKTGLLSGIGQGLAGAFAVQGVINFTGAVKDAAIQYEKTIRTLSFSTGSVEAAGKAYEFARGEAQRLNIGVASTALAFSKFAAAAKGTSVSAEDVRTVFTGVLSASRALGLATTDVDRTFRAFTQIIAKGKVTAEEFRGQIGDALPVATAAAAQALGVTTDEFSRLLDAGELTLDFLPKLGAELQKQFGGIAAASSDTLSAAIEHLDNSWTRFKLAVADTQAFQTAAGALGGLAGAIDSVTAAIENADKGGSPFPGLNVEGIDARRAAYDKLIESIKKANEAADPALANRGNQVPGRAGLGQTGRAFLTIESSRPNLEAEAKQQAKAIQDAEAEAKKAAQAAETRAKEASARQKQALAEQSTASKEAAKFEQERVDQLQEALQEEQDARDEVRKSIADQAAGIQEQIDAVNAEAEALKLGGAEGVRYAVVQREVANAIRELGEDNLTAGALAKINELADAQARLFTQREGDNQIRDAAETTAREFERQSDAITQTLTDAIFRGFENGKGFAENFKDTVVNLFKTLILRPVIEAIVKPVAEIGQKIVGSLVDGVIGIGAQALGIGGGGSGILGGLLGAGVQAFDFVGPPRPGTSVASTGTDLISQTLQTGFSSVVTGTETVTAAINQLGFEAGLTGGPSGQVGALGSQSASSLLGAIGGGVAIAGLSYGLGGLIGAQTGSALQGAAAGAAGGAVAGAVVGSVIPVIGTAIGAIIGAIAGGAGGGTGYSTPPRGFATFGAEGISDAGGKKGFSAEESLFPIGRDIQKSIKAIDKDLGLKLIKDRIKFWIGFKAGKGFRTTVAGKGEVDFQEPGRLQAEILRQELKDADSGKPRSEFAKRVLARGLPKDTLSEQLASFDKDLKVRSRLREFTKQVEFDPAKEKTKELNKEIKALTKAFSGLRAESRELGLDTTRADKAFKKTIRRKKDEILSIEVGKEAEKITAQQQAYQLAGKELPADLQAAGLTAQFKVLGIQFRELGLDTKILEELLGEALSNLKENVDIARQQSVITAQAQAYQLAGKQAPFELQAASIEFQFRMLGEEFKELGLDAGILSELLAEALQNLQDAQDQARINVQAQAFQLAGRQVPVELQRAGIEIQFAQLGEQFLELGLDASILSGLLAEALANLEEAREAAKIQVQAQAYQLAGRDVPIAIQQAQVIQQFAELGDAFAELGLDSSQLAQLLGEALQQIQENAQNLLEAQYQEQLSAQSQAYQLAGRDAPMAIQRASIEFQFHRLGEQFKELGLDSSILSELLAEALANLEEAQVQARQSALERAYQLAGEEIPKEIQIAGIMAEFKELGELFLELGLDTGILGPLLQEAIDKINKAGDDLRTGGFIGFIDEFGNISEALGNQMAANDSQFSGQSPAQAVGQDFAAPPPAIHPAAPSPFSNTNPSLITSTPPWEMPNGPPSGPRPAPVGLWRGGGDVHINLNGPAVFDDITQAKFTREVGRNLRTRGARFG